MRSYRSGAILLRKMAGRFEAVRQGGFLTGSTASAEFHPFATTMHFLSVVLVPLLLLAAIALAMAHGHAHLAGLGIAGVTTGTKSSGSDFTGLNDAMKQTYTGPFATNIEGEMEVTQVFMDAGDFETTEGPDGKQINFGHYMAAGGGVSNMLEDDYLPDDVAPVWKQSSLNIQQIAARAQLSGRTLRRVKEGPAAFASWAEKVLPEKAKRVAWSKDRQLIGTGTGIVGRLNGTIDGTGDSIDDAFGIAGLEGALNLIQRADSLRYSPNADGSSPRTGVVIVDSINYGAATYNTLVNGSTGTATSAADEDYVFVGGANTYGCGAREFMGLEGIVDDGTNLSTFQTLTRSSYPDILNAQVVDSTTYTQTPGVLSENIIDYVDSLCWERAGGKPNVLLVNRNGQRSFWNSLKGDRTLPDPQGQFAGGKKIDGLKMILGDRVLVVKAARKVPSSRAYLLDTSVLKRFKIGAGSWDSITGSVWNRVTDSTGAKDAVFAVYIEEEAYGSSFPARCGKITKLLAA